LVYSKKGIEIFSFPQGHVPYLRKGERRMENGKQKWTLECINPWYTSLQGRRVNV